MNKINDFITAYSKVLNLREEDKNLIIETIESLIEKYKKTVPRVPIIFDNSQNYLIKPKDDYYTIEDFFLNRLMRNIWNITEMTKEEIQTGKPYPEEAKGVVEPNKHQIVYNHERIIRQQEEYKQKLGLNYSKSQSISIKKSKIHEITHALQTIYEPNEILKSTIYEQISKELEKIDNGKYKNILNPYSNIQKKEEECYLSSGIFYNSKNPKNKNKIPSNINGYKLLNEILNETESLELTSQETYLTISSKDSSNYFKIKNPESSNRKITNYGELIKILLGTIDTFMSMYINPSKIFEVINRNYNSILKNIYNNDENSMEIIFKALENINETNNKEEHLKLNYALAKCLEKKIEDYYLVPTISDEEMLNEINKFEEFSITNDNEELRNSLEHIKILNNLRLKIKNRNEAIKESKTLNGNRRM